MNNKINYQDELIDSMLALDEEKVLGYVKAMIENEYTYNSIIACLNIGVSCVGNYFERGEYFIGDLIICGMIYRDALRIIMPLNTEKPPLPIGRIVIGVVQGDIHDIGKDIVVDLLRAEHFEVIDLGVDVKADRFVYAIKTYMPDVILLSGLLTFASDAMDKVIKEIEKEGLRDKVKILIGGGCTSEKLAKDIGADGWAYDTMATVNFCKKVISDK